MCFFFRDRRGYSEYKALQWSPVIPVPGERATGFVAIRVQNSYNKIRNYAKRDVPSEWITFNVLKKIRIALQST